MAKTESVWGIDIGNASLKALRCRPGDRSDQIVAEAFDYIEYPKILTQPGANPEELIGDALNQFQSRNNVRGDRVAITISGQSGLARFIKLPPVEAKRIPDIVRYEARQQIPFDLNDVIWDYQRIGGGMEEEGFVLDAEVGLFAMKRDQVFRSLEPFRKAGIEVDVVQLAPLALYNYFAFDQLQDLPTPEEYDSEDPPPSYVIVSMGTDATDLVVTNGFRVWQRSIPLGGNHFTRALTKELKLTFAKAEHLKRNASTAQDPKAVFQAMRPVFNDLLTEIQRSITYFTTIDRAAKIESIVTLGNAMKLPGLRRYLAQTLGYNVVRVDSFRGLVGPEVINAPAFKDNQLSFGPCFGLALQTLGKGGLETNLLPEEIVKDRLVREKKPWALAAAAVLLLACTVSFVGYARAMSKMSDSRFEGAKGAAESAIQTSKQHKQAEAAVKTEFEATDKVGKNLVENVEGRVRWLELLRAINTCLPRDEGERPEDISLRNELQITSWECVRVEKLEDWFTAVEQWYQPPEGKQLAAAPAAAPPAASAAGPGPMNAAGPGAANPAAATPSAPATAPAEASGTEGASQAGPTGPGWVIVLQGHHFHNSPTPKPGFLPAAEFVRETLIKNLEGLGEKVLLPKVDEPGNELVSMEELGIGYPVLVNPGMWRPVQLINPNVQGAGRPGMMPGMPGMPGYGGEYDEDYSGYNGYRPGYSTMAAGRPAAKTAEEEEAEDPVVQAYQFDFQVQFCWQPVLPSERHQEETLAEQPSLGLPGPEGEAQP